METRPENTLGALVARQLQALDAWNAARHTREALLLSDDMARSREHRMDYHRRLDALRRTHEAVVARTQDFLGRDPSPLMAKPMARAVLAHCQEWFADKVSGALAVSGVQVVAVTGNAADALGLTIAEQPELILVGERLEMLRPPELIAELALFAPSAAVVVQVPDGDDIGAMLDAGARSVLTRQVPPSDVAETMTALLSP